MVALATAPSRAQALDLRTGGRATAEEQGLGERVRELRSSYGWKQAELARRAGVATSLVSRIESGVTASPRRDSLELIARALQVSVSELIGESSSKGLSVSQVNIGPTAYVTEIVVMRSSGGYDFQPSGDSWPVPVEWARGKQLVATRVAGDCMEPELMKGDTVIVDLAQRDPAQGDLVAVLTQEGAMIVQRFNRFQGIPMLVDNRNRLYPLDNAEIQGTVVSALRRYK